MPEISSIKGHVKATEQILQSLQGLIRPDIIDQPPSSLEAYVRLMPHARIPHTVQWSYTWSMTEA